MNTLIYLLLALNPTEVKATYYNCIAPQTDSSPLITACNIKIDRNKLEKKQIRYVALSRDLLKRYKYRTYINVVSNNLSYNGRWYVVDTMNKRFTNTIDFLQHITNKEVPPTKVIIYN